MTEALFSKVMTNLGSNVNLESAKQKIGKEHGALTIVPDLEETKGSYPSYFASRVH